MKSAKSNGEIWMVTDRHQVSDLVRTCLQAGTIASTILIREKDWSFEETATFCQTFNNLWDKTITKPKLILNWNGTYDPSPLPIEGVHLSVEVARGILNQSVKVQGIFQKKKPLWKIGASLHDEKEWEFLKELPLDYVLISNVFSTSCKPGKRGLGLNGTAQLLRSIQRDKSHIQAYGLGGLKVSDLDQITDLGLQGIVLRSAFF